MAQTFFNPPILELGPDFFDEVEAASFPKAALRFRNQAAAKTIGLENFSEVEWKNAFWSFQALPNNLKKPLALRYHGHQFGVYNPQLGDGRGFLYAQLLEKTGPKKRIFDLGTKGSGQTPYSRQGDGRLTLKGAFREALCTELLESLGVSTSQTLSIFETGEDLLRHDEPSPTRSAVLVRLSYSHLRIGTFQRLARLGEQENLKKLIEYSLKYYDFSLSQEDPSERAAGFLKKIVQRAAALAASYMTAGFVHGVLNTDNINITGESFDYGPYRFLPFYDPKFTAAYFDHQGLYCFGRQPVSFLFALEQLAASMTLIFPDLPYKEILESFSDEFNASLRNSFLNRLNLKSPEDSESITLQTTTELIAAFFTLLETKKVPFEQCFFDFFGGWQEQRLKSSPFWKEYENSNLKSFFEKFQIADPDKITHPYFKRSTPETLLIDQIEALWQPIAEKDDWQPFQQKIEAFRSFRGLYHSIQP